VTTTFAETDPIAPESAAWFIFERIRWSSKDIDDPMLRPNSVEADTTRDYPLDWGSEGGHDILGLGREGAKQPSQKVQCSIVVLQYRPQGGFIVGP
jgi:hypothetical protein